MLVIPKNPKTQKNANRKSNVFHTDDDVIWGVFAKLVHFSGYTVAHKIIQNPQDLGTR